LAVANGNNNAGSVALVNQGVKKDTSGLLNIADNQAPGMQIVAYQPRYISRTGDPTLIQLERDLNVSCGKDTKINDMLDSWLTLLDRAKEEDYYEKKFWAFLNGYLNLKMA